LQLLNKLVNDEHYYEELSDQRRFMELTVGNKQEVREAAFELIANMKY
jgi:hypothetical protein